MKKSKYIAHFTACSNNKYEYRTTTIKVNSEEEAKHWAKVNSTNGMIWVFDYITEEKPNAK